ncbi:hypothetical protein CEXT_112551 [Caerostris extrusa]|uniref:G-protein coupled receptors family 1 profile domain-containing protein n=1 Tax=Caerostris extrusa TaxID=172846 RepID=A0AAV4WSP7_CAEEX|nr:hypothetical protein CEXT_112551 [Caerostris extrusa]
MFSLYLSTFTLVVIGFDRLCAVRFPMRRIKARMQVHKAVIAAWVLSAVLSAPQRADQSTAPDAHVFSFQGHLELEIDVRLQS